MAKHPGLKQPATNQRLAVLILRLGLAFVLVYAAVSAFRQPATWISFVPPFSTKFIVASASLHIIAVVQIILALWLLVGKYSQYAALFTAALLFGIVIFNLQALIETFRDIGLIAMALALYLLAA